MWKLTVVAFSVPLGLIWGGRPLHFYQRFSLLDVYPPPLKAFCRSKEWIAPNIHIYIYIIYIWFVMSLTFKPGLAQNEHVTNDG